MITMTSLVQRTAAPVFGLLRADLAVQATERLDRVLTTVEYVGSRVPLTFQSRASITRQCMRVAESSFDAGARIGAQPPTSPGAPRPPHLRVV